MQKELKGIEKTIRAFQERYSDLDALTIDELIIDDRLNSASSFREYVYYNVLMIKNSGSTLISQLRKLRFEKFIQAHVALFYNEEKAERCAKEQIAWFRRQLTV